MATSYGKGSSKGAAKKGAAKKASGRKASAKQETSLSARATGGSVPPYGEAIRQATARGDEAEMRRAAASARKWIKDAQAALEKLEKRLGKSGGAR
ncbi:MAG TPA: DUF1843 domain-containing protein [Pyrinomonadaceae bacterium]|jgi:thioredoxin-like negative regulator of GroEL